MNPDTMTVDQCISWLAEDDGWHLDALGWWYVHPTGQCYFPYEPDLKFAQMHIPEDFNVRILIEKGKVSASAVRPSMMGHSEDTIINANAEDELTARYRLAVKCRMALKTWNE